MKKLFTSVVVAVIALASAQSAYAGGIMANTNQSPEWVRSLARGTAIDAADAVYYNPAGTVFMRPGFHIAIGNQFVIQNRRNEMTYAPFAFNGGKDTKQFDGKTFAPLLPNLDLVWNHGRVAVMASVGIGGGGGSAKYDNGLGAFESAAAALPLLLSNLSPTSIPTNAYSISGSLKGFQVTYAFNVGASVRLCEWVSLAAQLRMNYVTNNYKGSIGNIMINPTFPALGLDGSMVPAYNVFMGVAQAMAGTNLGDMAADKAAMVADKEIDCQQRGFGLAPVVAVYFNHKESGWSAAAKYEFRTAIDLKNKTKVDGTGLFPDKAKSAYDQPALLTVAVTKRFLDKVSLTLEYHTYFDKEKGLNFGAPMSTTPVLDDKGNIVTNKKSFVKGNTMEYIAGVEWNITNRWLVSGGLQYSKYNLDDRFHSELGFSLDCLTVGLGGAFCITDNIRVNLAACHGFYFDKTINSVDAQTNLPVKNVYSRRSTIISLGFNFAFGTGRK